MLNSLSGATRDISPDNLTAGTQLRTASYTGQPIWSRSGSPVLFYTVKVSNTGNGFAEIHLKSLSTSGTVTDIKTLNTIGYPVMDMIGTQNGLLFANDDGTHGLELWQSDGTTSGTFLLKDINPGAAGSYLYSLSKSYYDNFYYDQSCNDPHYPQNSGHWATVRCQAPSLPLVYFLADDGKGVRLFATDGQKDTDTVYYTPQQADGKQSFVRGQAVGTHRITAMDYRGTAGSGNNMECSRNPNSYPNLITAYLSNIQAYEPHLLRHNTIPVGAFTAASGSVAAAPYSLTYKVDDFDLNPAPGGGSGATGFTTVNTPKGNVSLANPEYTVFTAETGTVGHELYVAIRTKETSKAFAVCTDLTCHDNAITMALLADLFPGKHAKGKQKNSNPSDFVRSGDTVYFLADTAAGTQIFKTAGTAASTSIYATLPTRNTPISLTIQGATLKVTARYSVAGKSDQFNFFDVPAIPR